MQAGGARGKPDPAKDVTVLAELRKEGEAIDQLDQQLKSLRDWAGHETDPTVVALCANME